MRSLGSFVGAGGLDDVAVTDHREAFQFDLVRVETCRTCETHVHAEQQRDLRQRTSHVGVVADVGDGSPDERAEPLTHRQRVGERLQRVGPVGEHVDDRDGSAVGVHRRDHPLDGRVLEDAGCDHGVVTGHDPSDVLHRFSRVEADLLAAGVDRVTAELHHCHLHRVAGSVGRLLEDQRGALAGERCAERLDRGVGDVEDRVDLVDREVGDVEQVARHQVASWICVASASAIIATASSISSSVTVIGGSSRMVVAFTALTMSPASSRSA